MIASFNGGFDGEKVMATLIAADGTKKEVRLNKGWTEIHLPKTGLPPRFYSKPTEYRSDAEYTVYARVWSEEEGEVFKEAGNVKTRPVKVETVPEKKEAPPPIPETIRPIPETSTIEVAQEVFSGTVLKKQQKPVQMNLF